LINLISFSKRKYLGAKIRKIFALMVKPMHLDCARVNEEKWLLDFFLFFLTEEESNMFLSEMQKGNKRKGSKER
jgi:hypothetical protein